MNRFEFKEEKKKISCFEECFKFEEKLLYLEKKKKKKKLYVHIILKVVMLKNFYSSSGIFRLASFIREFITKLLVITTMECLFLLNNREHRVLFV